MQDNIAQYAKFLNISKRHMQYSHMLFHGRFIFIFAFFLLAIFWSGLLEELPMIHQSMLLLSGISIVSIAFFIYIKKRPDIHQYMIVKKLEQYNKFSAFAMQPLNDFLIHEKITDEDWRTIWLQFQHHIAKNIGIVKILPIVWLGTKKQLIILILWYTLLLAFALVNGGQQGWRHIIYPMFLAYIYKSHYAPTIKISYRIPGQETQRLTLKAFSQPKKPISIIPNSLLHITISQHDMINGTPILMINSEQHYFHAHRDKYFIQHQFADISVNNLSIIHDDKEILSLLINDVLDKEKLEQKTANEKPSIIVTQDIENINDNWQDLRLRLIQQKNISESDLRYHRQLLDMISRLNTSHITIDREIVKNSYQVLEKSTNSVRDLAQLILYTDRLVTMVSQSINIGVKRDPFGRLLSGGNTELIGSLVTSDSEKRLVDDIITQIKDKLKQPKLSIEYRNFLLRLL